jgi:hypothetical protein
MCMPFTKALVSTSISQHVNHTVDAFGTGTSVQQHMVASRPKATGAGTIAK